MRIADIPVEAFLPIMDCPGGISIHECVAIYCAVRDLLSPSLSGVGCDLGSQDGRSCLPALIALDARDGVSLDAVEPDVYVADRVQRRSDRLTPHKSFGRVVLETSTEWLSKCSDLVYAFVDSGNHERHLLDEEMALLRPRLLAGGLLLFHDYLNQFIAPGQVYDELVASGEFEPFPVNWLAIDNVVNSSALKGDTGCWAKYGVAGEQHGQFVGVLRKK